MRLQPGGVQRRILVCSRLVHVKKYDTLSVTDTTNNCKIAKTKNKEY